MRSLRPALLTLLLVAATSAPAFADATVFLGATTTPTNRQARGVSIGTGLLLFGFEFEYSSTSDDPATGAPSLKIGSGNGLLQLPTPVFGIQPYVTAGAGIYRERIGAST